MQQFVIARVIKARAGKAARTTYWHEGDCIDTRGWFPDKVHAATYPYRVALKEMGGMSAVVGFLTLERAEDIGE
jgi:hypothetical protein